MSAKVGSGAEAWLPLLERAGIDTTAAGSADLLVAETAVVESEGALSVIVEGATSVPGYTNRRYVVFGSRDRPVLLVPRDRGNVTSYALSAWSGPRTRSRALRSRLIRRLPGPALRLAHWPEVTVATRDPSPPYVVAAALEQLRLESPVDWLLICGQSDELGRAAFLLFPESESRPRWIVKFMRVPSYPDPIDRDEQALATVAAAGGAAAAHAPRFLGRFEVNGLAASIESAAPGRRLSAVLSSYGSRAQKRALVDAVAEWIVRIGVETRHPGAPAVDGIDDLPAVLQHNDLGAWNIISDGGSDFTAVDWESANPSGLPLWDLWYFLADALRLLDGDDADDGSYFVRLFRGEAAASPQLFRWTRAAVASHGIPTEAVGKIATLCWLHHGLSHEARDAAVDRFARGGGTRSAGCGGLRARMARRPCARGRLAKLDRGLEDGRMRPALVPAPIETVARGPIPSFSVVIAAYNAAETIAEALDSVLAQTVQAQEIVVCDDGSADDLAGAVAPFRDRITLVRQENAGEGAAKNRGASEASGDYVVFLDADDTFLPERLEALGELAATRPDLDILTTDAFLEVDGTVVRRCYQAGWTFEVRDQRGAILERNFIFGLAAVRRSRFLEHDGFDASIRHGTDWDLWCRMLLDGSRVGLVDEPLARYRLRPSSLSADRSALLEGRCVVLERAAGREGLTAEERRRVGAALVREQGNVLMTRAGMALREGSPKARRLALDVARRSSLPLRTRLRAMLAALAPGLASRRLAEVAERNGVAGPAGVPFPAATSSTPPHAD